ncbi:hypothetical protein C900_05198 [Fulvivirga imtechensis AK7]|uniref:Uncharacterized protein n=1 Tax=Fulvivirga imtechensis AK7 TaxID=1237149 RepID=L8JZP8_9BACT|nr:pinensin family lanthipeptide [Fulvivirga imtechensis]ELR73149.1 hypothetical protein C900_05198 [Fulvivirga imtechensis AK7]
MKKEKMKLRELHVQSFITKMDYRNVNTIHGGGDPVPTIATIPVRDCKPVPTTDIVYTGNRYC